MTQRVLIISLPLLLRQIVLNTLEVESRAEIAGSGEGDTEEPSRRVLTIEPTGRSAYLFSMQPGLRLLREMSTDILVKAIHGEFTEH